MARPGRTFTSSIAAGTARRNVAAVSGVAGGDQRRRRQGSMSGFLTAAALMLGAAVLFVILFRRLGLGATLGYIVSGAVLGPYALNLIGEAETIQSVAEIGIALLL